MLGSLGPLLFNHPSTRQFRLLLRCYSAPFYMGGDSKKINDLNHGGKILLPPSILDMLIRFNISYPMMFKLTNVEHKDYETHCGVLEFLAEEGRCYLPSWMMRQLHLKENENVLVRYATLSKASYARLKPQSTNFLSITNPRAVLEVELRKFACLTKGDIIAVDYNEQLLELLVVDVKPDNAVSIIECDMNVEFDTPEGYVEETKNSSSDYFSTLAKGANSSSSTSLGAGHTQEFSTFSGDGYRLDGKEKSMQSSPESTRNRNESTDNTLPSITFDPNYKPGKLCFIRHDYKNRALMKKEIEVKEVDDSSPFMGAGNKIRTPK